LLPKKVGVKFKGLPWRDLKVSNFQYYLKACFSKWSKLIEQFCLINGLVYFD
jgi:hypothetical protein